MSAFLEYKGQVLEGLLTFRYLPVHAMPWGSSRQPALKRKRSSGYGTQASQKRRISSGIPRGIRATRSSLSSTTHLVKRKVFLGTSTLAAGTNENFLAFSFQLSDLPNYSEYTSLYDQYMLVKVDLMFVPSTTLSFQGTPYDCNTTMFLLNDFDDDSVPTTLDTLLQSGRTHQTQLTRNGSAVRWSVRPRISSALATGGGTGAIVNTSAKWLDAGGPSVKHFGLKMAIRRLTQTGLASDTPTFAFDTYATYTLLMRNPR